ncbi:CLTH domain-containing protein [Balamuthia mandrillaris]
MEANAAATTHAHQQQQQEGKSGGAVAEEDAEALCFITGEKLVSSSASPSSNQASIPSFLHSSYLSQRDKVRSFDREIRSKIRATIPPSRLNCRPSSSSSSSSDDRRERGRAVDVVVGIPYYTELTNILSVLVTLREVFVQRRRERALLVVMGEFSRADMVELINASEIEEEEDGESKGYVAIETMWKPHPRYQQKPWTVRAFQQLAALVNDGEGAHLLIVDADIQFNHWELSAHSLVRALLDPLVAGDAPRSEEENKEQEANEKTGFVVLSAPRSFIADDSVVHLFSFLMVYAMLGCPVQQIHGGEFSIHKDANKAFLRGDCVYYDETYCVEGQLGLRTFVCSYREREHHKSPQNDIGNLLEWRMKGKWHAKITLSKLLDVSPSTNKSRLDFVTERTFQDCVLFSALHLYSREHTAGLKVRRGGLSQKQDPDPNLQLMRVLAPVITRKEMLRKFQEYYHILLQRHLSQGKEDLPLDSNFVQNLLPFFHRIGRIVQSSTGYSFIKAFPSNHKEDAGDEAGEEFVFGPEQWAAATCELLCFYRDSQTDNQRSAIICANRLLWLLGSIAFLNHAASKSWGEMNSIMAIVYAPVFRWHYLTLFIGLSEQDARAVMQQDPLHNE